MKKGRGNPPKSRDRSSDLSLNSLCKLSLNLGLGVPIIKMRRLKEMIYFVDWYICSSLPCHTLSWQPGNDGPHDGRGGASPSGDDKVGRSSHAYTHEMVTIWFTER